MGMAKAMGLPSSKAIAMSTSRLIQMQRIMGPIPTTYGLSKVKHKTKGMEVIKNTWVIIKILNCYIVCSSSILNCFLLIGFLFINMKKFYYFFLRYNFFLSYL